MGKLNPYPIDVNGMINNLTKLIKEVEEGSHPSFDLTKEPIQNLRGWLVYFKSLKVQGIKQTDSFKVDFKKLMNDLGFGRNLISNRGKEE